MKKKNGVNEGKKNEKETSEVVRSGEKEQKFNEKSLKKKD